MTEYQIIHYENKHWHSVVRVYGMYTLNQAKKKVEQIKEDCPEDEFEIVKLIKEE
jgi:hypothetical protein